MNWRLRYGGYFEAASEEDYDRPEIDNEETSEEGHGRIEHRSYFLSTDLSSLSGVAKWSGLKAIGMVQSERHCAGRVSFEQRYNITSLGSAKLFQRAVRSHWGIENERKRPAMGAIDVRRGWTLGVNLGPGRQGRDGSAAGLRPRRAIAPWAAR